MIEYCWLENGRVVSMSIGRTPDGLLSKYSSDATGPIDSALVPLSVLKRYAFWDERP